MVLLTIDYDQRVKQAHHIREWCEGKIKRQILQHTINWEEGVLYVHKFGNNIVVEKPEPVYEIEKLPKKVTISYPPELEENEVVSWVETEVQELLGDYEINSESNEVTVYSVKKQVA